MILQKIRALKQKVEKAFKPETEFSKRIKFRYATYWPDGFGKNIPSWPRQQTEQIMSSLRENPNWQRQLENKYNSREFVKSHGCRVPDLYWHGSDYTTFDFESLPACYVLRPTIGYSAKSVFLMKDGINIFDGRAYTKEELIAQMQMASSQNPEVEFLCEEFLTDEKGVHRIPDDYKFFMFNGEIATIQQINRFSEKINGRVGAVKCYDESWKPMRMITNSNFYEAELQPPPKCLPELIDFAKELSKTYQTFVRIDFYATHKGAVFGEFCPTPLKGKGFTSYGSRLLISKWEKNCKNLI